MGFIGLIVAIFGISAVQLLVKHRFNVAHGAVPVDGTVVSYLLKLLVDPWLWLAEITLVVAALLWYFALSRIPLSVAIAFAALVYPLVMVGSMVVLGERVNLVQFFGCALIVGGIWLVAAHTA